MELKDMTYEELELLSYTDLTYMLLKESKKAMNTPTIFKKICDLLEYDDDYYAEAIGDYYTSLTIDKRFILLENNDWDLRERHFINLLLDEDEDKEDYIDDDEEEFVENEDEIEEDDLNDESEELEEEFDEDLDDEELEDEDEIGLEGLTILQEDDLDD